MKCYAKPHDTPPSVGAGDAEHLPRQDGTIRREPNGDAPTGWGCTAKSTGGKKVIDWRNYRNTND